MSIEQLQLMHCLMMKNGVFNNGKLEIKAVWTLRNKDHHQQQQEGEYTRTYWGVILVVVVVIEYLLSIM